jgi:hypothetical protein
MFCQCGGTGKGIKSKVGGELDIFLSKHCSHTCVIYVLLNVQSLLSFSTYSGYYIVAIGGYSINGY